MTFPRHKSILRGSFALWLLLSSLGFAQRDLKDIPDPDPELERKTFIVVRFEIDVTTGGALHFTFGPSDGLSFWVDAKPTPIQDSMTVELDKGRHRFTLAIDREARSAPLRIEVNEAENSKSQFQIVSGK